MRLKSSAKGISSVIFKPTLQVTGLYKGVRLASDQDLYSQQLLLDPSFTIPSPLSLSPRDFPCEKLQMLSQRDIKGIVARGICITRSSIKPGVSNCSVVYPPRCKRNLNEAFITRVILKHEKEINFLSIASSFVSRTDDFNQISSDRIKSCCLS